MNLVVMSLFRNSAQGQAQNFVRKVARLRDEWGAPVRFIAVHGDSVDCTQDVLMRETNTRGIDATLVRCDHGNSRVFGSCEDPARFKALSLVLNAGLNAVQETDDLVWYVESDLLWDPEVVKRLAERISPECDCVAPLVFAGKAFYDIWGFRKNGERFFGWPPYHNHLMSTFDQVDSVGSAFVMKAAAARVCRVRDDYALVGLFRDFTSQGFRAYVDTTLRVNHPT